MDDLHEPHPTSTCDAFPLAVALAQAKREIEQLQRQLAEAVANEREACAKVADESAAKANAYFAAGLGGDVGKDRNAARYRTAERIAAAIRERTD